MDRIIEVKVNGSYLELDSRQAGVQYEANARKLRITFDEGWDGCAKTVTFWNALKQNPVKRVLTTDLLEDATVAQLVYLVPIPGEAMDECGEMSFVIDGWSDDGLTVRQRSVGAEMVVTEAPYEPEADEATDPTPTQAEQLQVQIDATLETIQEAHAAAAAAAASAQAALDSENYANGYMQDAQMAAEEAEGSKEAAEAAQAAAATSETNAKASETAAANSATQAAASETSAANSESGAATSAQAAAASEQAAATAAQSTQTNAAAASKSAESAAASATNAAASESAAASSASSAAASESAAQAAQAAAEKAAAEAEEVAGGDFAAKTHASQHASDGDDPITPEDIGADLYSQINGGSTLSATSVAAVDYVPVADVSESTAKKIALSTLYTYMMYQRLNAINTLTADTLDSADKIPVADASVMGPKALTVSELLAYMKANMTAGDLGAVADTGDTMTGQLVVEPGTTVGGVNVRRTINDVEGEALLGVSTWDTKAVASIDLKRDDTDIASLYLCEDGVIFRDRDDGGFYTLLHSGNFETYAAAADHDHAAGDITSGTLAVARGGTGVTSNPSMLINLGSTSAASVFAASPRPGVTGTLPVANGGTGATTFTSGAALVGAGTGAVTTRTIRNNTATSGAVTADTALITSNTLRYAINRTTSVAAADTNYTTLMARGSSLNSSETNPSVNGSIAWTYE